MECGSLAAAFETTAVTQTCRVAYPTWSTALPTPSAGTALLNAREIFIKLNLRYYISTEPTDDCISWNKPQTSRNLLTVPNVPKLGTQLAAAAAPKVDPAKPSGRVDDRELVRLAQADDKEAFEELVRRHQQRVFAVAGGILRRREDVEDVAQQVFVKAYFSLKRFDQRAAFSTWLYKITVNECWDVLRKRKVRPLLYESDLSEEQARQFGAPEREVTHRDISEKLEARQNVERLLEGLGERDRMMLILKEVEGFSVEEIAHMLDLNSNTVKVRLFRARRRIVRQARKAREKPQF